MEAMNLYLSDVYEPWFNLAVEDWIFTRMDPSVPTLYLWRNKDTVVIGRYQNPWTECRLDDMKKDDVYLARRQSGGGAVYHDLNNTNFTFLAGVDDYSPEVGFGLITRALNSFGIEGEVSGRNDLIVTREGEPRKFSGSAFRKLTDRAFHHGTLLINSDLTRLNNYLTPPKKKLEAKGIKSVRSRVINLAELNDKINHEDLCREISGEFQKAFNLPLKTVTINREFMEDKEGFKEIYEKLKSSQWLYGNTPPFTHKFEERLSLGQFEMLLDVKKGIIQSALIYTDSLFPDLIRDLQQELTGKDYRTEDVSASLNKLTASYPERKDMLEELGTFLMKEMD
ncbi:MAG: lipoate--protein ligase [Spirochaetales bacterium]|nr:lipoate--protein ligase [Spirochaetales bacterium]